MAAMRCPVHGPMGETTRRLCPDCMEFLVPDVPPEVAETPDPPSLCPQPGCGMELDDEGCPVHSLGAAPAPMTRHDVMPERRLPVVEFPWGTVEIGPAEVWIGRAEDCGPLVPQVRHYDNISRRHAVLWSTDSTLYVRDQSSTNGTFVNSRKLTPNEPVPLRDGDQLRFAADLKAVVRSAEDRT
ncbi:hypothetical protein JOF56_008389 [Kibdelosporangium banguiense]|uniref:FHA domain-containing protein n=1 Tax=Kibdelosporangium banguiense TaxID=1365924 RepID=A0ABS4TUD2_9PSEU|nr:FHA domain-containing protein [Kibdelosporangium banguiense]MBP2328004.1 hypothetical protein [Kibdelosporangium banguiense]